MSVETTYELITGRLAERTRRFWYEKSLDSDWPQHRNNELHEKNTNMLRSRGDSYFIDDCLILNGYVFQD